MIYVLDGNALIAFLRQEQGAEIVRQVLGDTTNTCFIHAVNLCEVYYDFIRGADEQSAQNAVQDLIAVGVVLREDMDPAFWQEAGRYKAALRRVSLADCFCMTLARRVNGELLTSDHHEFDSIVPLGLCPIRFIR